MNTSTRINGAEAILLSLLDENADTIFGYPGGAIMPTPDFPLLSKAFGIESNLVNEREKLDEALNIMLMHNGPYLLEVKIEKEANVFPMIYPGRAVDEIVLEDGSANK